MRGQARGENGYYAPEMLAYRAEERHRKYLDDSRNGVIYKCNEIIRKAEDERDIMLCILDAGLPVNNVIYYDHNKMCVFNWKDYGERITQEQFDEFMAKVDYSKLPEGVKFSI